MDDAHKMHFKQCRWFGSVLVSVCIILSFVCVCVLYEIRSIIFYGAYNINKTMYNVHEYTAHTNLSNILIQFAPYRKTHFHQY